MTNIINIIAKETDGKSFKSHKYNLESSCQSEPVYDEFPENETSWKSDGENDRNPKYRNIKDVSEKLLKVNKSYINFFLDGSRHVYHVGDISYRNRVFPVLAGQIGVACTKRENKILKILKHIKKNLIVLPEYSFSTENHKNIKKDNIINKIYNLTNIRKFGFNIDNIECYDLDISKEGSFKNKGIAVVQNTMLEYEKKMVDILVKENVLNQEHYLLKDGSLEYAYPELKYNNIIKYVNNYRFVIGVSKQFNPEMCKDAGGKRNSESIVKLKKYHRTPVVRVTVNRVPNVEFAIWYLRIRAFPEETRTPFEGVLKLEKMLATDDEIENGLNSELVDILSASIINERCPTCYGSDTRYSNHLYPVYLTEKYIKSYYLSEDLFLSIF